MKSPNLFLATTMAHTIAFAQNSPRTLTAFCDYTGTDPMHRKYALSVETDDNPDGGGSTNEAKDDAMISDDSAGTGGEQKQAQAAAANTGQVGDADNSPQADDGALNVKADDGAGGSPQPE